MTDRMISWSKTLVFLFFLSWILIVNNFKLQTSFGFVFKMLQQMDFASLLLDEADLSTTSEISFVSIPNDESDNNDDDVNNNVCEYQTLVEEKVNQQNDILNKACLNLSKFLQNDLAESEIELQETTCPQSNEKLEDMINRIEDLSTENQRLKEETTGQKKKFGTFGTIFTSYNVT